MTFLTFTPAPDASAVSGYTGIDHLRILVRTNGAEH